MSEHPQLKKELLKASRMNSNELKCALIQMNVVFKKGLQPQSYYKNIYIEEIKKKFEKIPYISPFKQEQNELDQSKYSQSKTSNAKSSQKKKIQDSSSQKLSTFFDSNKKYIKDENSDIQNKYLESSKKNTIFGLFEFNKHLDNLIIQQSQLKNQFEISSFQKQQVLNSPNKEYIEDIHVEASNILEQSSKKNDSLSQVQFNTNLVEIIQEDYQQISDTKGFIQEQQLQDVQDEKCSFNSEQISSERAQPKLTMSQKQIQTEFKEIFQQKNIQKIKESKQKFIKQGREQFEYINNEKKCRQYDIQNENLQNIQKVLLLVLALVVIAVLHNKLFTSGNKQQISFIHYQNQQYNYHLESRNPLRDNQLLNQYHKENTTTLGIITYETQIEDFYRSLKIEMKKNNGQVTFKQVEELLANMGGQRNLELYTNKLKRLIYQKSEMYESLNTQNEAIFVLKNLN
ncbi:hypothetical protein ABPG72_018898 [Tetrahymena utriculariae]